jgi:large repetitive protein
MKLSSWRQSSFGRLGCLAAVGTAITLVLSATTARAVTVTVGSPMTVPFTTATLGGVGMAANFVLPETGASVTSPITGTIVRWRLDGFAGGPFRLRVLAPSSGKIFTAAGTSAPESPASTGIETFPTDLPIKAGDIVGFGNTNSTDKLGFASVKGATYLGWEPALEEGSTKLGNTIEGKELGISADVQPPPGLGSISTPSGSIKGGTSVVITGHDFTGATAVKFGTAAASAFTVNSDSQITATSPPGLAPGVVDTSVTTLAGTTAASAADQFTYTACVVPKLKGKKLKIVRKKLTKADCKLAKVKGKKSKSAKVKKQSPKPGKVLAPGSKVNVTVK